MKINSLLAVILFVLATSVHAQRINENNPALLQDKSVELSGKQLLPDSTSSTARFSEQLYMYNPLFNPYMKLSRNNPALWDYELSEIIKLSDFFSITPYNELVTYVGLGSYNNIGASITWTPTNRLSINSKVFKNEQNNFITHSRLFKYGANFLLNYDLTDELQFFAWGQYLYPIKNKNKNKDIFTENNESFPQTHFGATLQYKSDEKTKYGVELERRRDNEDNKWKSVIKGKVSVGF